MHRRPMDSTAGVCSMTYGLISSIRAIPCRGSVEPAHTGPLAVLKQMGSAAVSICSISPAVMSLRPIRSAGQPVSASQRTGP